MGRNWVVLLAACAGGAAGCASGNSSAPAPDDRGPAKVAPVPARTSDPKRPPEPGPEEVGGVLGAGKLWGDYSDNAAAQDAKYKGKLISVKGPVVAVTPEGDGYRLTLETLSSSRVVPGGLVALFSASARAALAGVKPGQEVTVRGVCLGMTRTPAGPRMPNRTSGHLVTLDHCELVPGEP